MGVWGVIFIRGRLLLENFIIYEKLFFYLFVFVEFYDSFNVSYFDI